MNASAFLPGDRVWVGANSGTIRKVQSVKNLTYRVAMDRLDKKSGNWYTVDNIVHESDITLDA